MAYHTLQIAMVLRGPPSGSEMPSKWNMTPKSPFREIAKPGDLPARHRLLGGVKIKWRADRALEDGVDFGETRQSARNLGKSSNGVQIMLPKSRNPY